MATIYKRGKRWHAIIRRKGMKRVAKPFDSRRDAEIWARSIESTYDRGIVVDIEKAGKDTLSTLFERYQLETAETKRNSRCELYMLKILDKELGFLTLSRLTQEIIAQFRDNMLNSKSPSTVRNYLHLLSAVVNRAITEWGYELPYNPVRRVKKPTVRNARDRRLESAEEVRLLNAAANSQNPMVKQLIIVALETAMRLGEILSLEWDNIRFEQREAFLPHTKNGKTRKVPLTSVAVETLRSVERKEGEDRVFYWWCGPESVHNMWARLIKRAGIFDLRFHDLRHEATSRFAEAGMDILRISAITGHSSLQMLKRYTHFRTSDLAAELDRNRRDFKNPCHVDEASGTTKASWS